MIEVSSNLGLIDFHEVTKWFEMIKRLTFFNFKKFDKIDEVLELPTNTLKILASLIPNSIKNKANDYLIYLISLFQEQAPVDHKKKVIIFKHIVSVVSNLLSGELSVCKLSLHEIGNLSDTYK